MAIRIQRSIQMKSIIFLSDIHANFEALRQIKQLPEFDDPNVEFWFGGDYSDGFNLTPNATINTWNFIIDLCHSEKAKAILGNHDEFILDAAYQPNKYTWWEHNGRGNTLNNLGLSFTSPYELQEQLLYHYYDQMKWLKSLPLYLQKDDLIMTHAGFDLDISLENQSTNTMLWIREPYIYAEQMLNVEDVHYDFKNKTIVTGHSPTHYITKNLEDSPSNYCPIVHKPELINRYFIDGGSKSGLNTGRINLLKLDTKGNKIWSKYMTADGIFNY